MSKLTAAYIAIGYITSGSPSPVSVQDHYDNGQLDLIDNMVHYAEYIDALAEAGCNFCGGAPGVFDYEVTEAFGPWFGTEVLKLEPGHVPDVITCCAQLRAMCKKFFLRSWDKSTEAQLNGLYAALAAVPLPKPYGEA